MAKLEGPRAAARSGTANSLVVLLHGYGADAQDLFGLSQPLSEILPNTVFRAVNAPERCRVNPMGYQWFPIPWIDGSSEEERDEGFNRSTTLLDDWLTATLAEEGLTPDRLALVGFSQGTMMSLDVGLARPDPLAGIVGFSGRLARPERLKEIASRPPVVLIHGDRDDVIPVAALGEAEAALKAADVPVTTHVSPGTPHGIAPDGLRVAAEFLMRALLTPKG